MSEIIARVSDTVAQRRTVYGSAKSNMETIAMLWNVIFEDKLKMLFTAHDVATAMRLVKEARLKTIPTHIDSLEDIVGYVMVHEDCIKE